MPKQKRPREAAVVYAETRLEPWGKWSRDNPDHLGLPRVSIIHKIMRRRLVRGVSRNKSKVSARGKETLSFRPRVIGEVSNEIAEVDWAVASLADNLQEVIKTEYVDYRDRPLEDRCRATGKSRSRYAQLLESAKYSVFSALSILRPLTSRC